MRTRFFVDTALAAGRELALPPGPARHVQVLRLQPGAALRLFDGSGGEWDAVVTRIGRSEVCVQVGMHAEVECETSRRVTLAVGMPANDRMDTLVEKATELGAAAIVPLVCERSVLRLDTDRAARRVAHWRGVAIAACEQSGRNRLPQLHAVATFADWLRALPVIKDAAGAARDARWMLSLAPEAAGAATTLAALAPDAQVCVLSGPEGGLSPNEESLARAAGFAPVGLGPRVLRADTAPLAALAILACAAA